MTRRMEPLRGFSTECIHGHEFYEEKKGLFKVPIYQTAILEQLDRETGLTRTSDREVDLNYSREENLTVRALEKILSKLEMGEDALAFGSGMAAISTTLLSTLRSGDTIVVSKECYYTTQQLAFDLSKFGVECILAGPDTEDFLEKIDSSIKLVLLETITNPMLKIPNVREIAKKCGEINVLLAVDNTFATPLLYNPLVDGAWLVIHSTTKYIAGHNDVIGGAIIGKRKSTINALWHWRRKLGTIMSPFNAFLTIRGISTFKAAFTVQSQNALALAEFLRDNPKVEEVYYPGLEDDPYHRIADELFKEKLYGGLLSFKVKGGKEEALKVLRNVKIIKPAPSLGGVESLLYYPKKYIEELPYGIRRELGISENLLRLAVGLEELEDLKEDLNSALSKI